MIDNYFQLDDFVDVHENKTNMRFNDPEFVKALMNGVTSPASMIEAIEKYNKDHSLDANNRLQYGVGIGGDYYIMVLKAYKLGADTYAIVGRDSNGYATIKTDSNDKVTDISAAISTHIVPISAITDVYFGGYDKDKIDPLFTNLGVDKISEKELIRQFNELISDLNAYRSSGMFRNFINKFTNEFKTHKYNELSYEHKTQAYNLYVQLYVEYINFIKGIIAEYDDPGKIKVNYDRRDKSIAFVEGDDARKESEKIVYKKYEGSTDTDLFKNTKDAMIEDQYQRTFLESEIETFRKIIKKTETASE